jgi:hypothetical protein
MVHAHTICNRVDRAYDPCENLWTALRKRPSRKSSESTPRGSTLRLLEKREACWLFAPRTSNCGLRTGLRCTAKMQFSHTYHKERLRFTRSRYPTVTFADQARACLSPRTIKPGFPCREIPLPGKRRAATPGNCGSKPGAGASFLSAGQHPAPKDRPTPETLSTGAHLNRVT